MAEDFSNRDKAEAAKREVGWRRRVYPGLVERRGMDPKKADREIALMEAIRDDYVALAEAEEKARRLL